MTRKYACLLAIAVIGCGEAAGDEGPGPTWFDEPTDELPARMSDFGTFDGAEVVRDDILHRYEPRYPLWSAGAEKERAVFVPDGEAIDVGAGDAGWQTPDGTLLFKTFYWEERPVETRVMRKSGGEWDFVAYLWDDDGTDASRLEMRRSTPVEVVYGGERFEHRVPNENDCRKCHEPTDGMVLGFDGLQLGTQLDELHAAGVVSSAESTNRRELPGGSELERKVLGGLVGNCVNCHNGSNHDQASFDLNPEVAFENVISRETESSASAAGIRVVPGEPAESILFLAISGESDDPEIKEMPPVGLELRDEEWIETVRAWIEGLEGEN